MSAAAPPPRPAPGRPLKVGLVLPFAETMLDGATPRWSDIREMAVLAEEVGFDWLRSEWIVRATSFPLAGIAHPHGVRRPDRHGHHGAPETPEKGTKPLSMPFTPASLPDEPRIAEAAYSGGYLFSAARR
jgi:hypothetical protein